MNFAIKAEVRHLRVKAFSFRARKTMYGGRKIATGDTIFIFASENEGGPGLIARAGGDLGEGDRQETRDRPADAAGEHCGEAHRAGPAAPGTG